MDPFSRSHQVLDSGADLFESLDIEAAIESGGDIILDPIAPLDAYSGPIQFNADADDICFYMLNHTRLLGRIKVVKDSNTELTASDTVSIVDYLPQCLFKQYELYVSHVNAQDCR